MMRRWMILNGVLVVVVLGLTFQIVRTWARTLPPVAAPSARPGEVAHGGEAGKRGKRAAAEKAAQSPALLVAVIVDRDLFDPSRQKMTEEQKVQTVQHEPPPTGITLAGVRICGADREAFIIDASQSNTQRRIRVGDPVGNFSVKSIGKARVLLVSQAGDEATLSLEIDKSKGATAVPGAPGVRPPRVQPNAPGVVSGSPAAGVMGGMPAAAGIGGTPPRVAAPGAPGVPIPTAAGVIPPGSTSRPPTQPAAPQLPGGVREKIEQMRRQRGK
jgi:hypothetical protein